MRILILSHMYPNKVHPNNGIFIHKQIKYLVNAGCQVRVISPVPYAPKFLWFKPKWKNYGEIPDKDIFEDIQVYYPRYLALPGTWYHSLTCYSMYAGLRKSVDLIMRDFNPDIIHAHTATYDGYVGLMIGNKYNLPFTCSLRGSDIHTYPYYEVFTMYLTKKVLTEADLILSVSRELKQQALNIGTPKRDIVVIYNGCDINSNEWVTTYRKKNRDKLAIADDDMVIIYVGSIQKDKGIFELINTFYQLSKQYKRLHLIIIGDGQDRQSIETIVNKYNIGDKTHFLGNVPHRDIFSWLKSSDLFVYPSYNEGLPNAVLEAMASGLPVIATKVGGIPEAVLDGETGILVDSMNKDQLYRAIDTLLHDNTLAINMGHKGQAMVEKNYSWSNNAEVTIKLYEEILNAKN